MANEMRDLLRELPHVIVLAMLIIALLFVATKYKFVHCTQIIPIDKPEARAISSQWCNVYCSISGHSKVAIITGNSQDPGIGNADLLRRRISSQRLYTYIAPLDSSEISAGLLKDYELVVLTQFKTISLRQSIALRDYLQQGGSILWEGDAASRYEFTDDDKEFALAMNKTKPGFYEQYDDLVKNKSAGFGLLGDFLGAQYNRTVAPTSEIVRIRALTESHLTVQGVKNFNLTRAPYAIVQEDPRLVNKISVIRTPGGKEYPMFLERKFVGRLFYTAVPIEYIDSPTLLTNVMDYLVTC